MSCSFHSLLFYYFIIIILKARTSFCSLIILCLLLVLLSSNTVLRTYKQCLSFQIDDHPQVYTFMVDHDVKIDFGAVCAPKRAHFICLLM